MSNSWPTQWTQSSARQIASWLKWELQARQRVVNRHSIHTEAQKLVAHFREAVDSVDRADHRFSFVLLIAAALLAIPVVVLALQVICATAPGARYRTPMADTRPTVAVLVPAHDEAANIGETCRDVSKHLVNGDRLLVVADNCTDATADLAMRAGAEVIERRDPMRRGKGYALDFGVKHLARRHHRKSSSLSMRTVCWPKAPWIALRGLVPYPSAPYKRLTS